MGGPGGGPGGSGGMRGGPPGEEGAAPEAKLPELFDQGLMERLSLREEQKKQIAVYDSKLMPGVDSLARELEDARLRMQAGLVLRDETMHKSALQDILMIRKRQMELQAQRTELFMSQLDGAQFKILQNQFFIALGY